MKSSLSLALGEDSCFAYLLTIETLSGLIFGVFSTVVTK